MQVWNQPQTEFTRTSECLAGSAHDLLRHYARRGSHDNETLAALKLSCNDLNELLANGLLARAAQQPEGQLYSFVVRSLPDLWWIDLAMGVRALPRIAAEMGGPMTAALCQDALAFIRHADQAPKPHGWEGSAAIFSTLINDPTAVEEGFENRSQVLARGLALTLATEPDRLLPLLALVERDCSRTLLRAMACDESLLDNDRWITTLLLRGGPRGVALGAASLLCASQRALNQVRDIFSVAPKPALLRLAEAHGLLSLAESDGADAREALRTAFLTQAWQNNDVSKIPWWRAFRGEQLVTRSLPEIGSNGKAAALSVLQGLVPLLGQHDAFGDPARVKTMAECLAWVLGKDTEYCAALRVTESRLREIGQWAGHGALSDALRGYAGILVHAARLLVLSVPGREGALKLYARVLRLRKQYPELMPRNLFPDTLEHALSIPDPERAAKRWMAQEAAALKGIDPSRVPALEDGARPSLEDPLPSFEGAVTTAEGLDQLPPSIARWVGAGSTSTPSLIDILFPLPLRHLYTTVCGWMGMTSRATFHLTNNGKATVVVRRRLLGLTAKTQTQTLPDGQVFTFPENSVKADHMLGRWTALLLLTATVGSFMLLRGIQTATLIPSLIGSAILLFGLVGYAGALTLHRILEPGYAVAVRYDEGGHAVWRVDAETRHVLSQPPPDIKPE